MIEQLSEDTKYKLGWLVAHFEEEGDVEAAESLADARASTESAYLDVLEEAVDRLYLQLSEEELVD